MAEAPASDDLFLGSFSHRPDFKNCLMLIAMPHWILLLLGVVATLRLRREAMRVGVSTLRAVSIPWIAWWVAAMLTTLGANAIGYSYGYARGTFSMPTDFELFPLQLFVGLGYFVFLDRQTRSLQKRPSVSAPSEDTLAPELLAEDAANPSGSISEIMRARSQNRP